MASILLYIFLAVTVFLFLFLCSPGGTSFFEALWMIPVIYLSIVMVLLYVIASIIRHPICVIRFFIYNVLKFIWFLLSILLDDGILPMGIWPLFCIIFDVVVSVKVKSIPLFFGILFVGFIGMCILASDGVSVLLRNIDVKIAWFYQYFSNKASEQYAKIRGIHGFHYTSPDDYAEQVKQKKERWSSTGSAWEKKEQKQTHKLTNLDILFKDELMILDLYMQDFTKEDLSHRRNELLKKHHPDNFTDPKEIQEHEQITKEILRAYKKIEKEMKKAATV